MTRLRRAAVITYLIATHAALAVVLATSDFLPKVGLRTGLWGRPAVTPAGRGADYPRQIGLAARADRAARPGAALFVGDSLVRGLYTPAVTADGVNLGVDGDTAAGLLARMAGYRSLTTCRVVVVLIGVNDLIVGRSTDDLLADCEQVRAAIPPTARVVWCGLLPVDERAAFTPRLTNVAIRAVNSRLRDLCGRTGATFVDSADALADPSGELRPEYHVRDGLHLNEAGYAAWIGRLRVAVDAPAGE